MTFKLNIAEKSGKTFKLESDSEYFIDKELHNKVSGKEILGDLDGYEFEITGASDKAGFTALEDVEGVGLRKVLLSYEKGMKNRPKKEGKIKRSKLKPKGLRLRKTVRGNTISEDIIQINLKILTKGNKELSEIFPDQNKKEEAPKEEVKSVEEKPQEKVEEKQESVEKVEEKKENTTS